MAIFSQFLKTDRKVENSLRKLYHLRGYKEMEINKFEEYSLYVDHKNYLVTDRLVTFMNTQGELMAIKPDVTLSIIKNIEKTPMSFTQKMYYVDEVLRVSKENNEYKMIKQIGVELIGNLDTLCKIEILDLAIKSLESISDDCVLNISHLDFVASFLDTLNLSTKDKMAAMSALYTKSRHDIIGILEKNNVSSKDINKAGKIVEINSNIVSATNAIKGLVSSPAMEKAYNELDLIAKSLEKSSVSDKINLDFSVVSDLDYYNGIVFLGYVKGVPKAVISGGEYENLLCKIGNQNSGLGFALNLSQLNSYFPASYNYDFDIMIKYSADGDYKRLMKIVEDFNQKGLSVRLESASNTLPDIRAKKTYTFTGKELREETND